MIDALLSAEQAATVLGLSVKTLANWRVSGAGPAFLKLGGRVLYDPADLQAWRDARRRKSTTEGALA